MLAIPCFVDNTSKPHNLYLFDKAFSAPLHSGRRDKRIPLHYIPVQRTKGFRFIAFRRRDMALLVISTVAEKYFLWRAATSNLELQLTLRKAFSVPLHSSRRDKRIPLHYIPVEGTKRFRSIAFRSKGQKNSAPLHSGRRDKRIPLHFTPVEGTKGINSYFYF